MFFSKGATGIVNWLTQTELSPQHSHTVSVTRSQKMGMGGAAMHVFFSKMKV